jgi:hypothetical protein
MRMYVSISCVSVNDSRTYIHTYIHTYTRTHAHIQIYMRTYTHIYTQTRAKFSHSDGAVLGVRSSGDLPTFTNVRREPNLLPANGSNYTADIDNISSYASPNGSCQTPNVLDGSVPTASNGDTHVGGNEEIIAVCAQGKLSASVFGSNPSAVSLSLSHVNNTAGSHTGAHTVNPALYSNRTAHVSSLNALNGTNSRPTDSKTKVRRAHSAAEIGQGAHPREIEFGLREIIARRSVDGTQAKDGGEREGCLENKDRASEVCACVRRVYVCMYVREYACWEKVREAWMTRIERTLCVLGMYVCMYARM